MSDTSVRNTPGRKTGIDERPLWPMSEWPDVMTVEECARALRITPHAVRESIRRGKLPSLILGHNLIIPKLALLRVLESCGAPEITEGAQVQGPAAKFKQRS